MSAERCTIAVSPRDRFSLLEPCLETLEARTPEPHDLIVVVGGAPAALRRRLEERWGGRATLLFPPGFLHCAQARNMALRLSKTRLTVCMDGDVFPRDGWLEPLLRCQRETGAGLVVPLMLEDAHRIHTAGNSLFVTRKGPRAFARKVLPFHGHPVHEGTSLERRRADYGEMHLQLVDTAAALALEVHDERIKEGEELDSGLSWTKGGREIWFEPRSVVAFDFPRRIEHPDDVPLFAWRWDIRSLIPGYRVMREKWGLDMTELGSFKFFALELNELVGWLPRAWPSRTTLAIDRALGRLWSAFSAPGKAWLRLRAWRLGHYDWIRELEDPRPTWRRLLDEAGVRLPAARRGVRVPAPAGAEIEAYREDGADGTGPAASVRAGGEEVLSLACLGPGRGGYALRPARLRRWDAPRRYFMGESVPAQIDEAAALLERELPALIGASPAESARAARALADALRRLAGR